MTVVGRMWIALALVSTVLGASSVAASGRPEATALRLHALQALPAWPILGEAGEVVGVDPTGGVYLRGGRSLRLLDRAGDRRWIIDYVRSAVVSATVDRSGRLYVATTQTIDALAPNGRLLWRRPNMLERVHASAADPRGGVVLVDQFAGGMASYSATGALRWSHLVTGADEATQIVVGPDGSVYVPPFGVGIVALDAATGAEKWVAPIPSLGWLGIGPAGEIAYTSPSPFSAPPPAQSSLGVLGSDGAMRWSLTLPGALGRPAFGPDGSVYVISSSAGLVAIAPDGREHWRVAVGSRASDPAVGPGGLVHVVDARGRLLSVGPVGVMQAPVNIGGRGGVFGSRSVLAATTADGTTWLLDRGSRTLPARFGMAVESPQVRFRARPAWCRGRGGSQGCLIVAPLGLSLRLMAPRAAHVGITLRGPGSARTGGTTRAAFVPAGESTYRLTGANGLPCNFPVPGHSCTPTPGRYVVRARFKVGRTTIVTPPVSVLVRSSAGRDIASS